jgi:transcriptional regulator with XRE-family HTH domain
MLKQRREARHLSIEQVAGQTRIRTHYLLALENDDLSAIPSMPQARGFLRIYTEFLGLNPAEIFSSGRSDESQGPIPQITSPAEALLSPASSTAPVPDSQPGPTFFGGLRQRFARRSSDEIIVPQPEPALPSESEPEPEPFVPVRVHEDLPAASEEISAPEPEPIAEPESAAGPAHPRKQSGRKTSAKKPVRAKAGIVKPAKPLGKGAGKKEQVKKKITKPPSRKTTSSKRKISLKKRTRPTRDSLLRKPGSFHPHRRPAKPLPRTKKRARKRLSLKKPNQ